MPREVEGIELGTVLGVWAHPDDEAYLSAGLMALSVREGSRVVCVTATRGEGGSMDEARWPPDQMGAVREVELLKSLALLGVTEHHFLDLPDIDMDLPLPEAGAAMVRQIMSEVRPDTVLTFGPDGMTGHRAHMDVSRWATVAFRQEAAPAARLFYATYDQGWADRWVPQMNTFDIFRPGTPPVDLIEALKADGIYEPLPGDIADLKVRAIEAHVSQVEGLMEVFGEDGMREAMGVESFRLAEVRPS
jgi:LmbE family N-acetylglucosaminyl deacetylase